ncbi:MAG: flagellar hook-length control protein FliK [Marinosulfonomonas sp.]|nr:flagellar hook-length control protein FliK [Marinosulfonomonas sp.]
MDIENALPKLPEQGAKRSIADAMPSIEPVDNFEIVLGEYPENSTGDPALQPAVAAIFAGPNSTGSNTREFSYDPQTLPQLPSATVVPAGAELLDVAIFREQQSAFDLEPVTGRKAENESRIPEFRIIPQSNLAGAGQNDSAPFTQDRILSKTNIQIENDPRRAQKTPEAVTQHAVKVLGIEAPANEQTAVGTKNQELGNFRPIPEDVTANHTVPKQESLAVFKLENAANNFSDKPSSLLATKPKMSQKASDNAPQLTQQPETKIQKSIAAPGVSAQLPSSLPRVEAGYPESAFSNDPAKSVSTFVKPTEGQISESALIKTHQRADIEMKVSLVSARNSISEIKPRDAQTTPPQIALPTLPDAPGMSDQDVGNFPSKFGSPDKTNQVSHSPVKLSYPKAGATLEAHQISKPTDVGAITQPMPIISLESETLPEGNLFEVARPQLSAQPTTTNPAQPLIDHSPRIVQMIAESARALQDKPVELALSPEELGKVRLTLQAGDGSMVVSISAERSETLELLRRNIDQLAEHFREIGFDNLSFQFSGEGSSDSEKPPSKERRPSDAFGTTELDSQPTQDVHRLTLQVDGHVDIRL